MHQDIQPTNEQVAVIDAVSSGNDLKVKAYAGAGKTSTLKLVASRLSKKNAAPEHCPHRLSIGRVF